MSTIFYLTIVVFLLGSTTVLASNASSDDLILSAESNYLEYKYNQSPSISGIVTDKDGNPLSKVSVFASFPYVKTERNDSESGPLVYPSTIIGFTTFSDGKFLLETTNPSPPGEHTIKVTAKKDGMEQNIFVNFIVNEDGNLAREPMNEETLASMELAKLSYSVLEQKMESQKEQYREILDQPNNMSNSLPVAVPLVVASQNSTNDVKEELTTLEEKHAANSPRNAFASFIETIDDTLQNLFWDQFEFTQYKTDMAHQAKIEAINDGKTSQEAMKVFQKEAATPLEEIIEFNESLNVKHGFTNQTSPEKSDEDERSQRLEE